MSRKEKIKQLYVYLNGDRVGTFARQPDGNLEFKYDLTWFDHEDSRPISISMPFRTTPYIGKQVSDYFENLLPDNRLILERIQVRFQAHSTYCFDLLAHIGADCVGALQFLTEPEAVDVKKIDAKPVDEKYIAEMLQSYQMAPLGMKKDSDFRISIAGAQEKTALLWHNNQWQLPRGVTPTSHIIKLPIGYLNHSGIDLRDSIENEWLCLKILSTYGLPVNKADIEYFEDKKTLVVERFDRKWSSDKRWLMRLPQEDMCQALGYSPALKYESDGGPGIKQIMQILESANDPAANRKYFMKTVFLFWVLGAIDGHAKNFSINIKPHNNFGLTPIYDVISAYPIVRKKQWDLYDLKMAMGLKSKNKHYRWKKIQHRHWLAMAGNCKFLEEEMEKIIVEVCAQTDDVIQQVSKDLSKDFPSDISEPIFEGMQKAISMIT